MRCESVLYQVSKQCVPLFIGVTVLAIGISFGYNCGYAINPARDLAPRLFTLVSGWGVSVLTYPSIWWCLVPVLATHTGGILGAWLYYLAIELHWTKQDQIEAEEDEDEEAEEAESLPVKRDLESAAGGENVGMLSGGGAPPPLPSSSEKMSSGLREELKFRINK